MRGPHLSTGGWIFTGLVTAAVLAPTAVYAAASTTVAIGNASNTTTATVTTTHQLLTATVAPKDVVHAVGGTNDGCAEVYTPPAGKAIVVTSVTYDLYAGTAGSPTYAYLLDTGCGGTTYDIADTDRLDESQSRTFPIGIPMPSVAVSSAGYALLYLTGYLIPVGQLPATPPATKPPAGLRARR